MRDAILRYVCVALSAGLNLIHRVPEDQANERIGDDEDALFEAIVDEIRRALDQRWAEAPAYHRDVHVKMHGLARAEFEVHDDVPEELRHGVLASPGRRFPACVRFSNGEGSSRPDSALDGRGMAIKLMGVEGEKLLSTRPGARTQDFLMINGPVFFIENPERYLPFEEAVTRGEQRKYFFNPLLKKRLKRTREFALSAALAATEMSSPLSERYWSMSASRLGPHNIKFSALPRSAPPIEDRDGSRPDCLRDVMTRQLAAGEAVFEFAVQRQVASANMPIEDPTVEWREQDSPFIPVATIRIPQQTLDHALHTRAAHRLSFNPWHGLPAHRPLGGINRLRRRVYEALADYRRERNQHPTAEPESWDAILASAGD